MNIQTLLQLVHEDRSLRTKAREVGQDVKLHYPKQMQEEYRVGDHVIPDKGPHKGQRHQVIGYSPTGRVNIVPLKKLAADG